MRSNINDLSLFSSLFFQLISMWFVVSAFEDNYFIEENINRLNKKFNGDANNKLQLR